MDQQQNTMSLGLALEMPHIEEFPTVDSKGLHVYNFYNLLPGVLCRPGGNVVHMFSIFTDVAHAFSESYWKLTKMPTSNCKTDPQFIYFDTFTAQVLNDTDLVVLIHEKSTVLAGLEVHVKSFDVDKIKSIRNCAVAELRRYERKSKKTLEEMRNEDVVFDETRMKIEKGFANEKDKKIILEFVKEVAERKEGVNTVFCVYCKFNFNSDFGFICPVCQRDYEEDGKEKLYFDGNKGCRECGRQMFDPDWPKSGYCEHHLSHIQVESD